MFFILALLNNKPRSASVVTKSNKTYLLFITRDAYNKAILKFQRETMSKRLKILRRVHAFDGWNQEDMQAISNLLVETTYQPGEVICKEGELAQNLYIIGKGEARILKKVPVANMHFYGNHMTEANHPHLFHDKYNDNYGNLDINRLPNIKKKKKKRKHPYCFVELGIVQMYDVYGHVSLMPKNIHEQKTQLEKFIKLNENGQPHSNDKPGDIHAHHHLSSLVATTSMRIASPIL